MLLSTVLTSSAVLSSRNLARTKAIHLHRRNVLTADQHHPMRSESAFRLVRRHRNGITNDIRAKFLSIRLTMYITYTQFVFFFAFGFVFSCSCSVSVTFDRDNKEKNKSGANLYPTTCVRASTNTSFSSLFYFHFARVYHCCLYCVFLVCFLFLSSSSFSSSASEPEK